MLLPANVVNARFLSYPKPNWVAKCFHFIPLSNIGFAAAFIVNEMTIIRYLSVFRWKTVVPKINDNFFAIFFGLCNFVISLVLSIYANMGHNIAQEGISYTNDGHFVPTFRLFYTTVLLTIFIQATLGTRLAYAKFKQSRFFKKQEHESKSETSSQALRLNTTAYKRKLLAFWENPWWQPL